MKKINFIVVVVFAVLTACSGAKNSSPSFGVYDVKDSNNSETQTSSTTGGGNEDGRGTGSGNPNNKAPAAQVSLNQAEQSQNAPTIPERKIIRNADLQLEADNPEEVQQKITQIAESKGGFVVESTQSSSNVKAATRDTMTMTVRIPAAKFNESLDEIRKTSSRVIVETIKGQDVTEEFVDIEARLKTKRALEEQFLEIMKSGKTVEDALNVQRELANVRGEIERIEGRKRFLENQTSLSTIKVTIKTPAAFSGSSEGFFYRLKSAIGTGIDAAADVLFFLVTALIALLPFFLIIVLPLYLLLRYWIRKTRRRKIANEIAHEEIRVE